MPGVADELAQQGLVGGEKMRKHPVNERVHHDSQNLGGPRRGRERVKDAVPSRKLLEILRIHDKNQEAGPGPRRTCRNPANSNKNQKRKTLSEKSRR